MDHRAADERNHSAGKDTDDNAQRQKGNALPLCPGLVALAKGMPDDDAAGLADSLGKGGSCWVTVVMAFVATKAEPMWPITTATALLPSPSRVSLMRTGRLMRRYSPSRPRHPRNRSRGRQPMFLSKNRK